MIQASFFGNTIEDLALNEIDGVLFDLQPEKEQVIQQDPYRPIDVENVISIPQRKNVHLTVLLSSLIPGLGHTYLGDLATAGEIFSSASLCYTGYTLSSNSTSQLELLATASNIWSYGIYAAYRDARQYNGQAGYRYSMPVESFKTLALSPFRWSVLKKPEVWGGYVGALSFALALVYLTYDLDSTNFIKVSGSIQSKTLPLVAFPVGLGEESLFRGFLQSSLSESFTPWGGIAASSILFGLAHIPNAFALASKHDQKRYLATSIPFITALGTYFGWMTYKNKSLQESTAVHTWYDFTLFAAQAYLAKITTGGANFALSLEF
jgi:membrane protease YdiL (CAAX protease family)